MSVHDLSEIPSDSIRTELCKIIENHLKTKDYKVSVSSASQVGENNFLGIVYRVAFSKKSFFFKNGSTTKIIFKIGPQNPARRAAFFTRVAFMREIYMYNEVSIE